MLYPPDAIIGLMPMRHGRADRINSLYSAKPPQYPTYYPVNISIPLFTLVLWTSAFASGGEESGRVGGQHESDCVGREPSTQTLELKPGIYGQMLRLNSLASTGVDVWPV